MTHDDILRFLTSVYPYDSLTQDELTSVAKSFRSRDVIKGDEIFAVDDVLDGLMLIERGEVEIRDPTGEIVSILHASDSFGERDLLRDAKATTSAHARTDATLLILPKSDFEKTFEGNPSFHRFFDRSAPASPRKSDVATQRVEALMAASPVSVAADATLCEAAKLMRDRNVSCLCVVDGDRLTGILTTGDVTERAMAEGLSGDAPVSQIMTPDPIDLAPSALGSDVLNVMLERGIGHLPITDNGKLVGIVTQTDLTRFQAVSSARLVGEIARATDAQAIAQVTQNIPQLLAQLVAAGNRHEVVTRLITDITDAATRRLLKLAEAKLGEPPVPYLWLACGSQGRQEQTGVSDQDNCLFLSDDATDEHDAYFAALAEFVSVNLLGT